MRPAFGLTNLNARGRVCGVFRRCKQSPVDRSTASNARSTSDLQKHLREAVLSIPTPFTERLGVDYQCVRKMIQRGRPYGIAILALTSANSMYDSLTYDEIC